MLAGGGIYPTLLRACLEIQSQHCRVVRHGEGARPQTRRVLSTTCR